MIRIAFFALAAMTLVACGGAAQEQGSSFEDVPAWVDNPARDCAVGENKFRGNRSTAREAATAKARTELAKQLNVKVQSLFKNYASEGEADGKDFTEELIESFSRQITDQTLSGTRPTRTKLSGEYLYVEVCFDPENLANAFDRMDKLSNTARAALKKRARAMENSLDDQLEKQAD